MFVSTNSAKFIKTFGIDAGVKLMKESGFDMIDLPLYLFRKELQEGRWQAVADEFRAASEKYGVVYNQAHAPFGGGRGEPETRGYYVTHLVKLIPDTVRMAAAAGVRILVVHPLVYLDTGVIGHEQEHFDDNIEFFKNLVPLARECGVKIAVENLWLTDPMSGNIVNAAFADPRDHAAFFDAVNAPDAITLCLDVGHSALVSRNPADVIRYLGHDRLGALHIHDVDYKSDLHTLPWQAKLDWNSIASALGEIDYTGELTLEADSFVEKVPDSILPIAAKMMSETVKKLGTMVDSHRKSK